MNLNGGVSRSFGRHGSMPFATRGEDVQCTSRFQQDRSFSIPPSAQRDQMKAFHFPSRDTELLRLESISSPTSDPTVHELSSMLLSLKHCSLKTNKPSTIRRNKKAPSSTCASTNVTTLSNPLRAPRQQESLFDNRNNVNTFVPSLRPKREKRYTKVSHLSRQELYRKLHDRYVNLNKELSCTRIKMQKAKALSSLSIDSSMQSMATRTRSSSAGADILQAIDNTLHPQSQHQIRQRERLHYFQQYKKKKQSTQDLKFLYKRKRIASISSNSKLVYSSSLSPDIDQLSLSRIESSAQRMNYASPSSRRALGNTHRFEASQLSHPGRCGQNRSGDDYSCDGTQTRRIIADAIRVLQNDNNI